MKAGVLPVIFQVADRLAYYEALDKAHTQHDYQDFLQLSMAAEIKAFDTVLSLLG
jgi:hypothetical protein